MDKQTKKMVYLSMFLFSSYSSLYELNFMDAKPSRGFYKVTVSVVPAKTDARLIGTSGAQVNIALNKSGILIYTFLIYPHKQVITVKKVNVKLMYRQLS